jgi:hypothetical protein
VLRIAALLLAVCAAACGKKTDHGPPVELTGLAAIPSSADVVIGLDVPRLIDAPLIRRAVEQWMTRDATLVAQWTELQTHCKIDLATQVKRATLALGPPPAGAKPTARATLLVLTGSIPETDLSTCLRKMVGTGRGEVTGRDIGNGRTLYHVKDGARQVFYSYGRPDTIVIGTSEAYVVEAVGPGPKAIDNAELAARLKLVDSNNPVWAAGKVGDDIRAGLQKAVPNTEGFQGFVFTIDPSSGFRLQLGAMMATAEAAKRLEAFFNQNKGTLEMVAQAKSLATVVHKITIEVVGTTVWIRAPLDASDVNLVIAALDGSAKPAQDSPPPSNPPQP